MMSGIVPGGSGLASPAFPLRKSTITSRTAAAQGATVAPRPSRGMAKPSGTAAVMPSKLTVTRGALSASSGVERVRIAGARNQSPRTAPLRGASAYPPPPARQMRAMRPGKASADSLRRQAESAEGEMLRPPNIRSIAAGQQHEHAVEGAHSVIEEPFGRSISELDAKMTTPAGKTSAA